MRDAQGEHSVEDVEADFGVDPVVDGSEGDHVGVFELPGTLTLTHVPTVDAIYR